MFKYRRQWQGVGFVLQQQLAEGKCVLIQAGSCFLTPTEARYAVIELELLAVAWAVMKCKIFLLGLQHFTIITNHNPLIPILNNHRLDEIETPWLQHLRTRLVAFNFTAQWYKGAPIRHLMHSNAVPYMTLVRRTYWLNVMRTIRWT